MKHKIIIADDHILFAEGLCKLISGMIGFEVINCVEDGNALLKALNNAVKPDIIILDICMPNLNGIEAGKIIRQKFPKCKIIICTMYHTKSIKKQLAVIEPEGLISKSIDAKTFESILRKIQNGEKYIEESYVYENSCEQTILENDDFFLLQKLTDREKEVISLIKNGYSGPDLAKKLELSIYTINNHKSNIFQKLGINTSTALVSFAIKNGL